MLEDYDTKAIRGTCQVFGQVGADRPFYSYRLSTLTQKSEELARIFRNQTLTLTTDLEGSSEVGGLFLHPHERAGGSACCSRGAAICSSSSTARGSAAASSPSFAG
jgi:arginine N-succinyltransferase